MEISNEIKAKVFAQYLAQKFIVHNSKQQFVCRGNTLELIMQDRMPWPTAKLILKRLSDITDKDAFAVGELEIGIPHLVLSREEKNSIVVSEIKRYVTQKVFLSSSWETCGYCNELDDSISRCLSVNSYQYLISKGYDLPQYLLDGITLHEAGLAIYEHELTQQ